MDTNAIPAPRRRLIRTMVELVVAACIAFAGGPVRAQTIMGVAADLPHASAKTARLAPDPARARLDGAGTADPREQSVLFGGGFCETGGNPSSRSLLVIFAATVAVLIAGARQHC